MVQIGEALKEIKGDLTPEAAREIDQFTDKVKKPEFAKTVANNMDKGVQTLEALEEKKKEIEAKEGPAIAVFKQAEKKKALKRRAALRKANGEIDIAGSEGKHGKRHRKESRRQRRHKRRHGRKHARRHGKRHGRRHGRGKYKKVQWGSCSCRCNVGQKPQSFLQKNSRNKWGWFKKMFRGISRAFNSVRRTFANGFNSIKRAVGGFIRKVSSGVRNAIRTIANGARKAFNAVKRGVSKAIRVVGNVVKKGIDIVKKVGKFLISKDGLCAAVNVATTLAGLS
jgi:hypothetical protein